LNNPGLLERRIIRRFEKYGDDGARHKPCSLRTTRLDEFDSETALTHDGRDVLKAICSEPRVK